MEGAYLDQLDHRMPAVLCQKIINDSTKEKNEAIDSLGRLSRSRAAYYQAGYAIHQLTQHIKRVYESKKISVEERRMLLSEIFSNLTLNEGKIVVIYTPAVEFLVKWAPKLNSTFEPPKMGSFTNKTDDFSSACPVVRPLLDAFRTVNWEVMKIEMESMNFACS